MYKQLYEPLPNIPLYLRHIGIENQVPVTVDGLNALITAHILKVPFEALDAFPGNSVPPLGITVNYTRVVNGFRGGYCFQLNGLFCSLLNGLGFDAYSVTMKVLIKDMNVPRLHRGTVAVIDGEKYYCDVGFGGPGPDFALNIAPGTHCRGFHVEENNGEIIIWRDDNVTNPLFSFRDYAATAEEFQPENFYCSKSPSSRFAQEIVVNQRTKTGHRSINGNLLRICEKGEMVERAFETHELSAILWEYFHIRFNQ